MINIRLNMITVICIGRRRILLKLNFNSLICLITHWDVIYTLTYSMVCARMRVCMCTIFVVIFTTRACFAISKSREVSSFFIAHNHPIEIRHLQSLPYPYIWVLVACPNTIWISIPTRIVIRDVVSLSLSHMPVRVFRHLRKPILKWIGKHETIINKIPKSHITMRVRVACVETDNKVWFADQWNAWCDRNK